MNYFLTKTIGYVNYGMEHALVNRLKMFQRAEMAAKVVTLDFTLNGHEFIKRMTVHDEDLVNMFDFFGGTVAFSAQPLTVTALHIPAEYQIVRLHPTESRYLIMNGGRKLIKISPNQFDATKIGSAYYYDDNGFPIKKMFFDSRGFASIALFMGLDHHKVLQCHLRPDGTTFLEVYLDGQFNDYAHARLFRLLGYQGRDYEFSSLLDLQTFFLDELNRQATQVRNVFVSDFDWVTSEPLAKMTTAATRIVQLHTTHFEDAAMNPKTSRLSSTVLRHPDWWDQFDAMVVATNRQSHDITERLHVPFRVASISVGIVPAASLQQHVPFSRRQAGSVVMVARPAFEKRLDDAIKVVGAVHQRHPEVTLDLYGTGPAARQTAEWDKITDIMDAHPLWRKFIRFHGFVDRVGEIYDRSQILMSTSRFEGFGLSILEGLEHGTAVLAYDFNYGASEMIDDGQNGYLVEPGNLQALTEQLDALLSDEAALERMSAAAYVKANEFSETVLVKKWQTLINSFN